MYTAAEKRLIPLMVVILLLITISLWLLLRNKETAVQNIPFIVITLLLIIGEATKQIVSYKQGYNLWHLPLHFCSTYFLWFSLAEFSVGKMRQTMQNIAFMATVYLCMALYSSPRGILDKVCDDVFKSYFTAHSFFYHHLIVLYMMLSIAFKRFKPKKNDAWVWMICFACYFAVAAICAYTFNENYFNILNSKRLPIFEPLRLQMGQVIYNACLAGILIFAGAIILFVAALIREKNFMSVEEPVEELIKNE